MLKSISIKNIAVIENVNIEFTSGFNILTGETGAGKSIIIDSINLIKGERAQKNIVRTGEESARVDAIFDITDEQRAFFEDALGIEAGDEIMLSRTVTADGKSSCRIDGAPVTLAMLKTVGDRLIDIHGQHENTTLISKKTHVGFLDSFGKEEIAPLREAYAALHRGYVETQREIDAIDTDEKEAQRRSELLRFQIQEIEMSGIFAGEDTELEERRNVLANAYKIASSTTKAYAALYGGDDGMNQSAYDMLWTAIKAVEPIAEINEALSQAYSALSEASDIISANARFLKDYCDDVESTTGELDKIEERLEEIDTLKRKYGATIERIFEKKTAMEEEFENITSGEERLNELTKRLERLGKERRAAAQKLTDARKRYAELLCERVALSLSELCMPRVRLGLDFREAPYGTNGADDIEFLISVNAGESLKPLASIASGGELSRIMLAIKGTLTDADENKLLIFDEVDTGVSGAAAQSIGEKLWRTSALSQVICITHLPQIAAIADSHYLIQKTTDGEKTKTDVIPLGKDDRIKEIARTLGGADITVAAVKNAQELVELADNFKTRSRKNG